MLGNNKYDDAGSSDSEDLESVADVDTCTENELTKMFPNKFHIASEESVSLQKSYVLHMSASRDFDKIVLGTSTRSVYLFSLANTGLSRVSFEADADCSRLLLTNNICDVRFANNDSNMFYVGLENGTIFMHDLRTQQKVSKFEDKIDDKKRVFTCFDINQNDRVLCAGTEMLDQDVYAIFFDVRKVSIMGGYWESHSGDICSVRFHKENPDCIASGSTDGLINVYDLSQPDENDALEYCLNTESSVANLQWHRNANDEDVLSCITHTNDLHLYDVKESELIVSYNRKSVTNSLKRKSSSECNIVNCHSFAKPGHSIVIAGSNHNKGECLRSLLVESKKSSVLDPYANFSGNRQIIRTSVFNHKNSMLITGGEGGLVTLWLPGDIDNTPKLNELVTRTKVKKHKSKPY